MQVFVAQKLLVEVDRALELPPHFPHHLFARALHRRASARSGIFPVGDVDREDAVHFAVAELGGRHAAPELGLRDARQRPFGIDVNDVPVCYRQIAAQIELNAVHPFYVGRQRAQSGELRIGVQHLMVHQRSNALERQRRHVVVTIEYSPPLTVADGDAGDAHLVAEDLLDLHVAQIADAFGFQIAEPRIDPDQICRSVEQAISRSLRRIEEREHHLHEHVADGARAGLARLGRDQRARKTGRQEFLVRRRSPVGADELPPPDPLVFAEPALWARGEDLPEARAEERQIVRREADDRTESEENIPQQRTGIGRLLREDRRNEERGLAVLREPDACRRHQVVRHLASVERRRAPHRVDHVLVETRKEAKAVLAGQAMLDRLYAGIGPLVAARAGAVVDHRDAARLAAGDVAELEHDHVEAAFDQLVRRAHARHAAAENDHLSRHASPWHIRLSDTALPRRAGLCLR